MPSQLSTIMYISDYQEKASNNYFIGTAIGHTRLEEDSDTVQSFNITVFYPLDGRPTYVPKIKEGQVLSVSNSKFTKGDDNRIDLILNAAIILDIEPQNLPVYQVYVVGVAVASDSAAVTETGVQFDCVITDYFSKDKPVETPVTVFHPPGSRFTNQTTTVKRGSLIFLSGSLSSIDGKLYLELHAFNFLRGQTSFIQKSQKMPWVSSLSTSIPSSNPLPSATNTPPLSSNTPSSSSDTPPSTSVTSSSTSVTSSSTSVTSPSTSVTSPSTSVTSPSTPNNTLQPSPIRKARAIHKKPPTPTSTNKRKTRSSFKANKMLKIADLSTNALVAAEAAAEDPQ